MSVTHFEGTCDVCGETITFDHDSKDGMIDLYPVDDSYENGFGTYVRHYATAPNGANPDCAVYSSLVVTKPPTKDNEGAE